jgi:hypothetical protein
MPLQSGLTATINAPATINTNETVSLSATLTNVDGVITLNLGSRESIVIDRPIRYDLGIKVKGQPLVTYRVRSDGNGGVGFFNE